MSDPADFASLDLAGLDLAERAPDPLEVRRAFDRAAPGFDGSAVLHGEVRNDLLGRLDLVNLQPRVVIDAGAGTGHAARALARRYPKALVVALDLSPGMLAVAARRSGWLRRFARVCADAQRLPISDGGADLIVSNLLLPWCDLDAALAEFRRALGAGGLLWFTTLGPDTLRELRSAWQAADPLPHVQPFIDMHDIGDALVRAGFQAPVLDVERYTLSYADARKVTSDLRATGSLNAAAGRRHGLTGRRRFAAMERAYEQFRSDGRLPATYEVVFAHAWAPAAESQRGARGASVSLADLKRELRGRLRP